MSASTDNQASVSETPETQRDQSGASAPRRQAGGPPAGGPGGQGMAPVSKASDFTGTARRVLHYLGHLRLRVVAILLLGIGSVALTVTGPLLLGDATDIIFEGVVGRTLEQYLPSEVTSAEDAMEVLRAQGQDEIADLLSGMSNVVPGEGIDFGALAQVLIIVALVYVGAFVLGWLQGRLTAFVVQQTAYHLREEIQSKLARLPLRYVDRQPRGEILSRATNDVDNLQQTLTQVLSQLITSLLTVVGVLIMMLSISWKLALIAVITVPIALIITALIARQSQPQFVEQWDSTGRLNSHIEEMYTGHTLVKVFGHQETAISEFEEENGKLYWAALKAQFVSGIIQPLMMFVGNLNYVAVAVLGALQVASGSLSLGSVQAFLQYSRQFTQPINQIASMVNLVQSGAASAERIFDLLDAEEEEPDSADAEVLTDVRGDVVFDEVSFRYLPDEPLIDNLNLHAAPGQTIAIVGHTGAGKTTLVNLLMRFYDVDEGAILLDGVDTRRLTRSGLRHNIGMVLQDTWLFNGTITENIRYGRLDATDEEVHRAAEATYVDRFARALPEGYDTQLGSNADNLSVGERQLVTIARAFLSDPAILVLDEATSSVDTRTEVLVQKAMNALRVGRTSFVIAHRLSTIRNADSIIVMESGKIVEQGTHRELLAKPEGAYHRLYESQFAGALTGDDEAEVGGARS